MKYGYINKFTAQEGKRDALKAILLEAAEALETHNDCIQYLISTTSEPEALVVTEIWITKQAHDESLDLPAVKTSIVKAMSLIASVTNIAEQHIEGGKGFK